MTPLPAAVCLLLSLGAGLLTGLSRFGDPWLVGVALALATIWWWRQPLAIWIAAALAGRLLATVTLVFAATACAGGLPARSVTLRLHLLEPVAGASAVGDARVTSFACTGAIEVRWPAGSRLEAGTEVEATGRWLPRPGARQRGGVLSVQRFAITGSAPTVPERLRNWTVRQIRWLYGARSGTVEALVLNRRSGMPPSLRDRYARAGLVHILSISGFHVGVILGWCVLLGRLAGLTLVRAELLGAVAAVLYVLLLGWPPPAARAAILALVAAALHWRQRRPLGIPLLALVCVLVLLFDPSAVTDPGAWLSAGSLAGVLLVTEWSDRALGPVSTWRMLAASVGATLAAAPVTAWLFGTVSVAGIVLNFAAVPIAAIAVPGLLVSLLAGTVLPALAQALAAGAGLLLSLIDTLAWWGGAWSWAVVFQPAEPRSALPWLGAWGVAAWVAWGGTTRWEAARRLAVVAVALAWGGAALELGRGIPDSPHGLTLHFLDVGQGDAAAIRTPGGHWVLVDAGPSDGRSDAGLRVVAPFLQRQRVRAVSVALLSHAHADHLGGMQAVLDQLPVSEVIEPGRLTDEAEYLSLLSRLEAEGIPWRTARDSARFELDGVRFSFLHPSPGWDGWGEDLNEDSAVLLVEYDGFRALFPGDAGLPVESRLRGRIGRVDLLKVGHHGSRWATGDGWLAELRPRAAIISSGRHNRYGHPHAETLARLAQAGTGTWRTDERGTITVRVEGGVVTILGRDTSATWRTGQSKGEAGDLSSSGDDDRALHPGPGGEVSRGDGRALEPALRHRPGGEDHRRQHPARRAGEHPRQRR